ncbi:hypothetical protein ACFQ88_37875 [Paenibacillus sp. NPDC056579]|nr:hypothetical protein DVH26_02870 [Paenibacillus sp. H1-7]
MKKLLILTTALALSAVPATGFAQANTYAAGNPVNGSGQITILELMLNRSGTLPSNGEKEYTFSYDPSYGSTIRYYLEDTNHKGMSIYIYNSSNRLVASGHTGASNNWQFLNTFSPAQVYDDFTVTIVSDNGNGGTDYGYNVAVRAY